MNGKIIIVEAPEDGAPFEINGVAYRLKQKAKIKTSKLSPMVYGMLQLALAAYYPQTAKNRKMHENIGVIKEYSLIMLKKSKLSRSQRDWVVNQFETTYEKL